MDYLTSLFSENDIPLEHLRNLVNKNHRGIHLWIGDGNNGKTTLKRALSEIVMCTEYSSSFFKTGVPQRLSSGVFTIGFVEDANFDVINFNNLKATTKMGCPNIVLICDSRYVGLDLKNFDTVVTFPNTFEHPNGYKVDVKALRNLLIW